MTENRPGERRSRKRTLETKTIEVRLAYDDEYNVRQTPVAKLVDVSEGGVGLQLRVALPLGLVVQLRVPGETSSVGFELGERAKVCWCRPGAMGFYRVGLLCERAASESAGATIGPMPEEDLYELLQVNPKALNDTIHRVYRMLAQRYHPDNRESGDEEAFKNVTKAFEILGSPERRAAYDAVYAQTLKARWRVFHSPESARGTQAEKTKRYGVLSVLYRKRVQDTRNPMMSLFEMEDLLGIARDHLEFTLWYLRERGFVTRADNNKFQITVSGVDHTEQLEAETHHLRVAEDRQLPSASVPRPS
ncbi:DnaJ domain-containing protein [uncultured Paludibaculum sp.]|uniref:DnaJ domain-containing protein n=1 Tax=uncultured Paludibaculum sp. TaxID=1765020 RepID=UPI002AAA871E|nr:DnaJ domain-containing protein [uncultured Paludibaculum sp.]